MHQHRAHSIIAQNIRGWAPPAGLVVVLLALVVQPCLSATVNPHPDCQGPCGKDNECPSSVCKPEWYSCPGGTLQFGNSTMVVDDRNDADCHDTECALGGCGEGFQQVGRSKPCLGVGLQEHCCPLRPTVQCCQPLMCNISYADCVVPQQVYLNDPSRSAVVLAALRHGGRAPFPFYNASQLPPGASCQAVQVYGSCLCDDGRLVPGCEPDNSSSWLVWVDGPQTANTATAALLPANLSKTCTVAQPPAAPPAVPPPPPPTETETAAADATTQGLQPPPSLPAPPPPPGGGGGQPRAHERRSSSSALSSGWLAAVIVISCLALAGVTTGIVLWCCGLLPDLHNLRIRSLTTYEPIFTGQSYTPGLGGGSRRHPPLGSAGGAVDDIPWTRFCAAVTEVTRRIMYGRRYLEESASAAAAAERYRTLNSLGRRRSDAAAAAAGYDDGDEPARAVAGKKPTRGSVVLATYPSGRHKPRHDDDDDDLGVDEVFTLEDLGAANNDAAGAAGGAWRPVVHLPISRPAAFAGAGGAVSPQPLRASGRAASAISPSGPWWQPAAGAAAELNGEGASRGPSTAAAPASTDQRAATRPRLNQFGGSSSSSSHGAGNGGGGGGHEVIHTRPLVLSDGDGGDEFEVPPDVDAPLRWLPSPQVTGQSRDGEGDS